MKEVTALAASACLLLAVAACGGGSENAAPSVEEFADACSSSQDLDRAICECAARKAKAELSVLAFSFLEASLRDDSEAIKLLRPQMSATEATSAGMFMVSGPSRCAEELASGQPRA